MCVKFFPENLNPRPYLPHFTSTYTVLVEWLSHQECAVVGFLNGLAKLRALIGPSYIVTITP